MTDCNNRSAVISSSDLLVFPSHQETIDISSPLRNYQIKVRVHCNFGITFFIFIEESQMKSSK